MLMYSVPFQPYCPRMVMKCPPPPDQPLRMHSGRANVTSVSSSATLAVPPTQWSSRPTRVSARSRYHGTLHGPDAPAPQQSLRPSSASATEHCDHPLFGW